MARRRRLPPKPIPPPPGKTLFPVYGENEQLMLKEIDVGEVEAWAKSRLREDGVDQMTAAARRSRWGDPFPGKHRKCG